MLKELVATLRRSVARREWTERATHPFFGSIQLFAFSDSDKSYWEAEVPFEGRVVGIVIEAPSRKSPSEVQVAFARDVIGRIDDVFLRARPLLQDAHTRWKLGAIPDDWRTALEFNSFSVPADGRVEGNWELSFDSLLDRAGHCFTCYFEQGRPSRVSVDG